MYIYHTSIWEEFGEEGVFKCCSVQWELAEKMSMDIWAPGASSVAPFDGAWLKGEADQIVIYFYYYPDCHRIVLCVLVLQSSYILNLQRIFHHEC